MECRDWDEQVVRPESPIASLRSQFALVRIGRMNGVDLSRFEFDYDTTWVAFFLDADLNIYSRFGGRDEHGPESRLKIDALQSTMQSVLKAHQAGERSFQSVKKATTTPEDIPILKREHRGCVHCHQVKEYRLRQAAADGVFSQQLLFDYPLAESLGLKLNLLNGIKVESVKDASAAQKAGLQAGDRIVATNGVVVRSELDMRWALMQPHPQSGKLTEIRLSLQRGAAPVAPLQLDLQPDANWRQTELGWRKSQRSVPVDWGFRAYDLSDDERSERGLEKTTLAIRVISESFSGMGEELGLRRDDILVGRDSDTRRRSFDEWKSDMLRQHVPGSAIELKVLRDSQPLTLKVRFPAWTLGTK